MKTLDTWIQKLLQKPIKFKGIDDVELHLEKELKKWSLPQKNGSAVGASRVNKATLRRLQLAIRGHKHEDAIWTSVLWYLSDPLPVTLARDLIDRGVAIPMMSHTRQHDEVQWRLATIHENALHTLVCERYIEPRFTVEQFATMLEIYSRRDDGLLAILLCYQTQSPEKEAVFVDVIKRELKRFGGLGKKRYKSSGAAYFKQRLATRPDIIAQLSKKYQRLI